MTALENIKLDELDLKVLREIQLDSRISNNELARRIHLSQPATHARLKRLKSSGVIKSYTAILDIEKSGFALSCFLHIRLRAHMNKSLSRFEEGVRQFPEILECHYISGEFDYLLKAIFKNREGLTDFLRTKLSKLPDVIQISTSLILSEIKSTLVLPLSEG